MTPQLNLSVSNLKLNDESVRLIMLSLALECHEAALARNILSHSVEHQLGLVCGILGSDFGNLLDVRHVPANDATSIAAFTIGFSDERYRLLARSAKDRVAHAVDGDADV